MADSTRTETPPIERATGPEFSREQVLQALDRSLKSLKSRESQLTPKEKWGLKSVETSIENTGNFKRQTEKVELAYQDSQGQTQTISCREGIFINPILLDLDTQIEAELAKGDTADLAKLAQLQQDQRILSANSKQYFDRPSHNKPLWRDKRTEYEAFLISQDERATGDDVANYNLAAMEMASRMELYVPTATTNVDEVDQSTTTVTTTSTTNIAATTAPAASGSPSLSPAAAIPSSTTLPASASVATPPPIVVAPPSSGISSVVPPVTPPASTSPTEGTRRVRAVSGGTDNEDSPSPTNQRDIQDEFVTVTVANRTDDPIKKAYEESEEQLRAEMRRGSAWNPLNWPRKIALRVGEQYFRQRMAMRALKLKQDSDNTYAQMDLIKRQVIGNVSDRQDRDMAERKAAIERATLKFEQNVGLGGERVEEVQGQLKDFMLQEVLRPIINGQVTTELQVQAKLREFVTTHQADEQVKRLFGNEASAYGRQAESFATDLLGMADKVKETMRVKGLTSDQMNEVVKIRFANLTWGANSQAKLNNSTDRAIKWIESKGLRDKYPLGLILNPATVGAATSLAAFAFNRVTGTFGSKAAFAIPGVGLITGAAFGAFRRNYELKTDRAAHQVERAYNMQIPDSAKRRKELEKFTYNTASADQLLNGGGYDVFTAANRTSMAELRSANLSTQPARESLLRRATEIQTRLDFSQQNKVDLITFASRERVQYERLELVKAVAEARVALRRAGMSQNEIDTLSTQFQGEWNRRFTTNVEQQDKAFNSYRLTESAKAAAIGGVTGLTLGFVSQEVLAGLTRFAGGHAANTFIESAVNKIAGHEIFHGGPSAETLQTVFNEKQNFQAPLGDHSIIQVNSAHQVVVNNAANNSPIPGSPTMVLQSNGHITPGGSLPNDLHDEFVKSQFEVHAGSNDEGLSGLLVVKDPTNSGLTVKVPSESHWIVDGKGFDLISNKTRNVLLGHVTFDAQGKMLVDPANVHGVELPHDVLVNGQQQIDVLGPGGEWAKHQSTMSRLDAFYYKYPLIGERNELKVDTFIHDGHTLEVQIQGMTDVSQGPGLKDVNVHPEVITKGQAVLAFIRGDDRTHPIFAFFDNTSGTNFKLDVNDMKTDVTLGDGTKMKMGDLAKMIFDQQKLESQAKIIGVHDGNLGLELLGKKHPELLNVLKLGGDNPDANHPGWMAAGRLMREVNGKLTPITPTDPIHAGDKVVFEDFGAIRGLGKTVPIAAPIPLHETDIIPLQPVAPDIIPPHEAPVVPIPIIPRYPLEAAIMPLIFPDGYYGYLGGGISSELLRGEYAARRSPRFKENPNATLDQQQETTWYLSQLSAAEKTTLAHLESQISRPMDTNCRVAIAMPAYREGKGIYNSLVQFVNQTDTKGASLDPRLYEVVVYDNHPQDVPRDNTFQEIQRFNTTFPDVRVTYLHNAYPTRTTMGRIRRDMTNLILSRSQARKPNNVSGSLIISGIDADTVELSSDYIATLIDEFDKNPKIDALATRIDYPKEAFEKFPTLFAGQRLWEFLETIIREKEKGGSPELPGANSAIRASALAAIGGYNDRSNLGEDLEIGWMLKDARGWDHERVEYVNKVKVITDPRRSIFKHLQNKGVALRYEDWANSDTVRDLNWQELAEKAQPVYSREALEQDLTQSYDLLYGWLKRTNKEGFEHYFDRAMKMLGAEYVIENGKVKITDDSRLVQGLRNANALETAPPVEETQKNRLSEIENRLKTLLVEMRAASPAMRQVLFDEMDKLAQELGNLRKI